MFHLKLSAHRKEDNSFKKSLLEDWFLKLLVSDLGEFDKPL